MRALASIRRATEIFPIPGADAIEAVQVDGWVCVTRKGEFSPGELGVYFEIDSFLPASDSRFEFLRPQFIEFEGCLGARLRTLKLRGQLSQGLFMPISRFPEFASLQPGADVTKALGIKKWEPTIPTQLAGEVSGAFPSFIKKTDQERVQNLVTEIDQNQGQEFEITVKLDGSSMTVYRRELEGKVHFGVCSRNWELKETATNALWRTARTSRLLEALDCLGGNYAFQGELIGPGIQGNPERLKTLAFYLYDIFDIDAGGYVSPSERAKMMKVLAEHGFEINHVPILGVEPLTQKVPELLAMAQGPSLSTNVAREGLVFKRHDGAFSFKVISNQYLLKNPER